MVVKMCDGNLLETVSFRKSVSHQATVEANSDLKCDFGVKITLSDTFIYVISCKK